MINQEGLDELHAATGARFGVLIGQLIEENLELSKLLAEERAHIAQGAADQAEFKRQVSQLTAGAVSYEDRIHELENELAARPTTEQVAGLEAKIDQLVRAGPTVGQSAALELAQTEDRIKEAAPVAG